MALPILLRSSLRHFARHPLQTFLAVLGVALGLAVVVALEIANRGALEAFRLSSQSVTGRATHQIVGDSTGLPEEVYRHLRRMPGAPAAAPVVELHVRLAVDRSRRLRILGLDPFAEPGFRSHVGLGAAADVDLAGFLLRHGALVSSPTAAELGLSAGDRLALRTPGGRRDLEILGRLSAADTDPSSAAADLVVVDVGTAQILAGLEGRLSRIDLLIPDDGARAATLAAVAEHLPPGLEIVRPESRSAAAEDLTRAFRLNLRALSLLGLLCGAFLIYNTMTFAVVQRRTRLGILRTLGVTRREIFGLVTAEALLIGLIGSALGVAGGHALSRLLLTRVTQTINDLYFALSVQSVEVSPLLLGVAVLAGAATTVAAALGPAAEATATVPRAAVDRSELEARAHRAVPVVTVAGLVLAAGGGAALALPGESLVAGFVGLFLVLVGLTLLAPAGTVALMGALTPVAGAVFGNLGRMATRGVTAALSRTAVAVAALMMAVSVTVGVDIMIDSFRGTVDRWLGQVLPADLYLTTPAVLADRFGSAAALLDPALLAELESVPGVERIDTVRHARVGSSLGRVPLLAYELGPRGRSAYTFKDGNPEPSWTAVASGSAAIVTEPFASRHRLTRGESFDLLTPAGPVELTVAGIVFDYATEEGRVIVDQGLFSRLWSDDNRTAASLWLAPGADRGAVEREMLRAAGAGLDLTVRSNGELRTESMAIFDRTFIVTGVLRMLAVIVAFIGVLAALTALELERGRELALLRASGLTPRQVWSLVTSQTGLMGLTAGLLSLPVGLTMAFILVHVINRRSFGWTLETAIDPQSLLTAVGLALAAALLAGLYPAWRMSRVPPAAALRAE